MKLISAVFSFTLAVTCSSHGSVTATWSQSDVAAATQWLNAIETSSTRQNSDFSYFSTTSGSPPFSDQVTSNFTVWEDTAELNILGVGSPPLEFKLIVRGRGRSTDPYFSLNIDQSELSIISNGSPDESYYTFSTSFGVGSSFRRGVTGQNLVLESHSESQLPVTYDFNETSVPEPCSLMLLGVGGLTFLRRKK